MVRLSVLIVVLGVFILDATERFPKDYTVGKNVRLSVDQRTDHLTKQACMSGEQLPEPIKKVIEQAGSSQTVLDDLRTRDCFDSKRGFSWIALESSLKRKGTDQFLLFGFGSLMNKRTSYQPNINIPGIVFGAKRLYNLEHADSKDSLLGMPTVGYDPECLRLNTQLTACPKDIVNGLLLKFKIGTKDYADLKKRERLYRLVSVKVLLYSSLLQRKLAFKDAYILFSDKDKSTSTGDPHVVYNSLVMDGCAEIENKGFPGFLSFFLDTTYLADERTTIRDWIKKSCRNL